MKWSPRILSKPELIKRNPLQIVPAIDLKDGHCVRLAQGQREQVTIYSQDPVELAREFAKAGAETIHVVDLDAAFRGKESPNRSVVTEIARQVKAVIQFGGGIRTEKDVDDLLAGGIGRVVVGTLAAESPEVLEKLATKFGSRIAVGIDARDGIVMTRGWEQKTGLSAKDCAVTVAKLGVERIIYTDIKRDGMLSGPNIEQTVAIARLAGIHVTASGGVSSLRDLENLRAANEPLIDSVIVGKALYERSFTLEEALQIGKG
jgi:phosphoribosylformimino-5-aminoimidazole carboxamide ribotide isomerase